MLRVFLASIVFEIKTLLVLVVQELCTIVLHCALILMLSWWLYQAVSLHAGSCCIHAAGCIRHRLPYYDQFAISEGIRHNLWLQASDFALVGNTVAPGYDMTDFELGNRTELLTQYPQHTDIIDILLPEGYA